MATGDGLFEVIGRQRAHRAFRTDDVADELVDRLLTAATLAPSAENAQPWEFVVVRDSTVRAAIGELTAEAWAAGAREHSEPRLDPRLLADVDAGARGGLSRAPVLIVVCADLRRCLPPTVASSIFPAVQNLLLAATALGLGSALTTLATVADAELRTLLGLGAEVQPVAVVPVGWPARPLGPPRREPARAHAHRDRYGSPW